jgi:curved DNA-binding protein CbpA
LHVRTLLASCHEWKDGEFEIAKGKPSLDGELTIELPGWRVLMDMVTATTVPARTVWNKIGGGVWLRHEPRAKVGKLTPLESYVLDRTAKACRLEELQAYSSENSEQTLKTIYGLMLLGAVAGGDAEVAGAASREQCEQRLGRAESENHYQILGVDGSATEEDVREAYYEIARSFHPDRFRTGDLTDLLPRIEAYFSQATEAYNTLSHDDLRSAYDHEISDKAGKKDEPLKDQRYLARQNFARGKALAEKRRFQDALQFLRNAVQLDESEPRYHLEIGRVLALNPRHRGEAEQSFERALELNPTLVPAIFAIGELYVKQDRLDEARARFEDVLGWDPTHVEAQTALTQLGQPAGKRGGR